jgi:hypothetical protein
VVGEQAEVSRSRCDEKKSCTRDYEMDDSGFGDVERMQKRPGSGRAVLLRAWLMDVEWAAAFLWASKQHCMHYYMPRQDHDTTPNQKLTINFDLGCSGGYLNFPFATLQPYVLVGRGGFVGRKNLGKVSA